MKKILSLLLIISTLTFIECTSEQSGGQQLIVDDHTASGTVQDTGNSQKRPPIYYSPFDQRYSGGGFYALVDSTFGSLNFGDGKWQGYRENILDVAIDLGKVQKVTSVSGNFLENYEAWIFLPKTFSVFASDDMENYTLLGKVETEIPTEEEDASIERISIDSLNINTRYIRVKAISIGPVPEWHKIAKGRPAWFFIDEIIIK
ncbi:MAG: discoidin domain-containing protein [Bacteroidetes bacterium]|nr:discoidin domain-containing protein [Bacteroidota bacterium]